MKKLWLIFPMALILCFMVGCQDKEALAELEEMKAQADLEKQNEESIRRALELSDQGKAAEGMKFFSSDCVFHTGGIDYSSEEYSERAMMFYTAFPDLKHDIKDVIAEKDKVVLYMIESGTHQGEFMEIAATGKTVAWPVIAIYRFSEGVVEEVWVELDLLGIKRQLGSELKPN